MSLTTETQTLGLTPGRPELQAGQRLNLESVTEESSAPGSFHIADLNLEKLQGCPASVKAVLNQGFGSHSNPWYTARDVASLIGALTIKNDKAPLADFAAAKLEYDARTVSKLWNEEPVKPPSEGATWDDVSRHVASEPTAQSPLGRALKALQRAGIITSRNEDKMDYERGRWVICGFTEHFTLTKLGAELISVADPDATLRAADTKRLAAREHIDAAFETKATGRLNASYSAGSASVRGRAVFDTLRTLESENRAVPLWQLLEAFPGDKRAAVQVALKAMLNCGAIHQTGAIQWTDPRAREA